MTFLSGGSALNGLAELLARSGLHATHIISVFDNGGSTGRLRAAYPGIAVGDLRKRLAALGDRRAPAARAFIELLCARLPQHESPLTRASVEALAGKSGTAVDALPGQLADDVAQALAAVLATAPRAFDWRDCSIGNLILTGRYLQLGEWAPTLAWAEAAAGACGAVVPVTTAHAHLGARLANGKHVLGQRRVTDQTTPIEAPIADLVLHRNDLSDTDTVRVPATSEALGALREARVIVYGWGSFYTSILCSLLVSGVASALSTSRAWKVLLLNPFSDAETHGKQAVDLVCELFRYVAAGNGHGLHPAVTHVLALRPPRGTASRFYDPCTRRQLEARGVEVVEVECSGIPRGKTLQRVMECLVALR